MVWGMISGFVMMLGFSYIVWAIALKDDSNSKICGQIIAALILAVAIVTMIVGILGYGHRGKMTRGEWSEQHKVVQQVK